MMAQPVPNPDDLVWLALQPSPPENVRLVMDGHAIPIDCVYEGYQDGSHTWAAMLPAGASPEGVRIDVIPGHTTIRFAWIE